QGTADLPLKMTHYLKSDRTSCFSSRISLSTFNLQPRKGAWPRGDHPLHRLSLGIGFRSKTSKTTGFRPALFSRADAGVIDKFPKNVPPSSAAKDIPAPRSTPPAPPVPGGKADGHTRPARPGHIPSHFRRETKSRSGPATRNPESRRWRWPPPAPPPPPPPSPSSDWCPPAWGKSSWSPGPVPPPLPPAASRA